MSVVTFLRYEYEVVADDGAEDVGMLDIEIQDEIARLVHDEHPSIVLRPVVLPINGRLPEPAA